MKKKMWIVFEKVGKCKIHLKSWKMVETLWWISWNDEICRKKLTNFIKWWKKVDKLEKMNKILKTREWKFEIEIQNNKILKQSKKEMDWARISCGQHKKGIKTKIERTTQTVLNRK